MRERFYVRTLLVEVREMDSLINGLAVGGDTDF